MTKTKKVLFGVSAIGIAGLLVFMMQPAPLSVDAATIEMRPFVQTVEDQGRTRAFRPYMVAAPISGRLLRPELDAGDRVAEGDVIARVALQAQDQRVVASEQANLNAAQARLRAEQIMLSEARTVLERARRELQRRARLVIDQLTSEEEVEGFQLAVDTAEARVQSSQAAVAAASANVDSVRARLLGSGADNDPSANTATPHIEAVLAPTDGTILTVFEESERVVTAGTPLFQISNRDNKEVVVDLLTQDAVSVSAGDPVRIIGWGGDFTLNGEVRYIEPEAFTKYSALGVEEQRVNVIIDLMDAPDSLGAEYRVEVAIVVWESERELTVPASALFRRDGGWSVFVIEQQHAVLRSIEIDRRNREYALVSGGLEAGDVVIQYPSDLIEDGVEVAVQ